MVLEEEDKIERFIQGLPDNIQGNVTSSQPTRLQDSIMMANIPMDQKVHAYAARNADNKRKFENQPQDNHVKVVVTKLQTLKLGEERLLWVEEKPTRSFVLTSFSFLIDVIPTTLNVSYAIELTIRRVVESIAILKGCTLNMLGHLFIIDLMPIELSSLDVIIGMDWLSKYYAVIVCGEKIVQIPYGDEVLTILGDESNDASNLILSIISCTKTQKYIQRGCHVFLAQVTEMKAEDKLEEKRHEDVSIVQGPGATLVACSPYRLAPSEMQDLSTQLQELVENRFIRPSSSP
ncbi:putative reverse transcriptase domain-containing protein [Tanacetum coccineum]